MDINPSHALWLLLFVVAHSIPAWLIYEAMMAHDRKHKRRAKNRPLILKIYNPDAVAVARGRVGNPSKKGEFHASSYGSLCCEHQRGHSGPDDPRGTEVRASVNGFTGGAIPPCPS
jgi:hypothetical protein